MSNFERFWLSNLKVDLNFIDDQDTSPTTSESTPADVASQFKKLRRQLVAQDEKIERLERQLKSVTQEGISNRFRFRSTQYGFL